MPISRLVGCVAYDDRYKTLYGYVPSLAPGIAFVVLFGLSTLIHLGQTIWTRRWWTIVFALGAVTELLGWAARTWSAECPYNLNAFLMQITTLIIAPTFFTAGLYVILGRLISLAGPRSSPISATMYLWIFCTCDVVSLVIQAIGGGMAATAVAKTPPSKSENGTHIMVAGIVFQMASVTVFAVLFIEFLRRSSRMGAGVLSRKVWILVAACVFSCLMIYIRSIYRTVELLQGWSGYLITHEGYFVGFDACLMLLAVAVFNFVHPIWFLPEQTQLGSKTPTPLGRAREDMELDEKERVQGTV